MWFLLLLDQHKKVSDIMPSIFTPFESQMASGAQSQPEPEWQD